MADDSFEKKKADLMEKYSPDQQAIIHECIDCLKTTRKSGKIADSVILAELERWQRIESERVIHGIRVYMDKECYLENKNEKYLWGIIRNIQFKDIQRKIRGSPRQQQIDLPFKNKEAFSTCKEWLNETTGGNHDGK